MEKKIFKTNEKKNEDNREKDCAKQLIENLLNQFLLSANKKNYQSKKILIKIG